MMTPRNEAPPTGSNRAGVRAGQPMTEAPRRQCTSGAGIAPHRRRCPWFADLVRLASAPVGPYSQWRDTALIFAGSDAWEQAKPARDSGRRAVTVCPPGSDPAMIAWPSVRYWIGDAGDLAAGQVVTLARALGAAGAERVTLVSPHIAHGVLVAKRRGT